MIAALLLTLVQAGGADVVISGPRPGARAALDRAEREFRAGAYRDALRTLRTAIAAASDADPVSLAALWNSYATVALHEGDLDLYRHAVIQRAALVRRRLPAADPLVTAALIGLGDMWVELGNAGSARRLSAGGAAWPGRRSTARPRRRPAPPGLA